MTLIPETLIPVEHALVGWCETPEGQIYRVRVLDQRRVLADLEPDAFEWRASTHTGGACVAGWNMQHCCTLISEVLAITIDPDGAYHEFTLISGALDEIEKGAAT